MSELVNKKLTCIVCPLGCRLEVQMDSAGQIKQIVGNTCKRGSQYAMTEFTDPRRTLTSTVKLAGSQSEKFLPVRTSSPIPKPKIMEAMCLLNSLEASAPIKCGDVICRDFIEEGIDLIACKEVK